MPEKGIEPLFDSPRRPCREHGSCEIVDRHGHRLHIHVGPPSCPACGDPLERHHRHDGTTIAVCEHCLIAIREPADG